MISNESEKRFQITVLGQARGSKVGCRLKVTAKRSVIDYVRLTVKLDSSCLNDLTILRYTQNRFTINLP